MKKIIIYSTESCSHCQSAKAYLDRKGFSYEDKNVQSDKAARQELMDKGYRGVPIIVIGGIDVVGFDKEKIDQLLEL
ncbi:MAG: glutaredoxin family protein [Clostridiales bacterium]|nr:glutaredoxin family protein [Clostridiales bacterium]